MKITIQAEPEEKQQADDLIDLLQKARQRAHAEPIDLLIPELAKAHDKGREHRDRIERAMWKKIQQILGE